MLLFRKITGSAKVLKVPDPCRDVWGSHNTQMNDDFLINLHELIKKDNITIKVLQRIPSQQLILRARTV